MRRLAQVGLALVLTANLTPVYAADAHMYRCVSANGRVYYSDVLGLECEGGEQDRLTRHGLVLDRPEPSRSNAACKLYVCGADRDRKTAAASNAAAVVGAEQEKIGIERARLVDLLQREAALAEKGKPIPRSLRKDIESAESDIERLAKDIETRQLSLDQIVQRFDDDKARFRELTVPQ